MSSNGVSEEKRAKLDSEGKGDDAALQKASTLMDEKAFQAAVEQIDNCQIEIDNLNEQAAEAILQVEVKFNELRKPHYAKRAEIIAKVPDFWCTAFVNHPQLSPNFSEEEHKVLRYLKNFYVEEFEDIKNGYKIILKFDSNPYFENDTLVKEFHLGGTDDPYQVVTPIKWKPGKNFLSNTSVEKDSRKRKAPETFFSWFTSSELSPLDEIADWLKDELWPNPLQFFMMPSVEEDNEDDDEEEGEDGGEEDEDADEGDSEDGSVEEVGDS